MLQGPRVRVRSLSVKKDIVAWESGRIIATWSFRWVAEVFHEFSKQGTDLEAAQVRGEEAVKRHATSA